MSDNRDREILRDVIIKRWVEVWMSKHRHLDMNEASATLMVMDFDHDFRA